jgi:putative transcriptional regulator
MVRFILDLNNLPELSDAQRDWLDAMTDAEITAAAEADIDNPPLTDEELNKLRSARLVRRPSDV